MLQHKYSNAIVAVKNSQREHELKEVNNLTYNNRANYNNSHVTNTFSILQ